MRIITDLLLVIFTTYIMWKSLRSIVRYGSSNLVDFAILMLYLVQCLPVLCDLIFGYPEYKSYLYEFDRALNNDVVALIYNIYISLLFFALYFLSKHKRPTEVQEEDQNFIEITEFQMIPNFVLILLSVAPFIHIVITGNLLSYLIYGSPTQRGLSSNFTEWNSVLIITSIAVLTIWYFREKKSVRRTIVFLLLMFLNIWASGKRYTVATAFFCYVYMFSLKKNGSRKQRSKLFFLMATLIGGLVIYSTYYLIGTRGVSNDLSNIYATLRVDFGRDDVVKFTILRQLIDGRSILDYPGQTILSTIFMVVPRSLYPTKPYPHYRYLTSAIYDVPLLEIPSGMTPSFLEMSISNFGIAGFFISIIFIVWYCRVADRESSSAKRFLYAVVMLGFMTQSLDSMWPLFYLVLFFLLTHNIRFTVNGKRLRVK